MLSTTESESSSGYHSFVVRVYVGDSDALDHGEVLHVASRSRLRFRDWLEAMDFMARFSDSRAELEVRRPAGVTTHDGPAEASLAGERAGTLVLSTLSAIAVRERPAREALHAVEELAPTVPIQLIEKSTQLFVKRLLDIAAAFLALAVLATPMLLIALAIRLDTPGPVIYRQRRIRAGGRVFTMYKFRSMVVNADDLMPALKEQNEATLPLFKIRDDPRKTRVGLVLRRFSLDELPQLFNVLRGDLSLVGPRPPLASELEEYSREHWQRLAMPQGMTGLWQVSGRSLLNFDDMLRLDLEYIDRWSMGLDFKILLQTIPAVLSGKGAF